MEDVVIVLWRRNTGNRRRCHKRFPLGSRIRTSHASKGIRLNWDKQPTVRDHRIRWVHGRKL
jgi:hypothetical protein